VKGKHPPGPAMTLCNMRELGVRNLIAHCLRIMIPTTVALSWTTAFAFLLVIAVLKVGPMHPVFDSIVPSLKLIACTRAATSVMTQGRPLTRFEWVRGRPDFNAPVALSYWVARQCIRIRLQFHLSIFSQY
jgi:hypothetical protein